MHPPPLYGIPTAGSALGYTCAPLPRQVEGPPSRNKPWAGDSAKEPLPTSAGPQSSRGWGRQAPAGCGSEDSSPLISGELPPS